MSFSNILSSAEPAPKPKAPSPPPVERKPDLEPKPEPEPESKQSVDVEMDRKEPVRITRPMKPTKRIEPKRNPDPETEPEHDNAATKGSDLVVKKRGRRSTTKGRASDIRDEESSKKGRRASSKKASPTPRVASKRQANGQPKPAKTWSEAMERKIANAERQIEHDASKLDPTEFDEDMYRSYANKRRREMADLDVRQSRLRREDFATAATKKLCLQAELGKRRYDDVFYDEALNEVRDQELFAEKERKKDMQRKRRREKSMAVTMEQKEAALKRANAAEDETERQKHLRDAERANKKAQQTKLILQKGIKGPARNLDVNLDGGTMSSFQASDAETPKGKSKGRGASRPKKSKEQKQAEKDSAEAAQAALDAGEELPPREEGKVRIKIKGR